MCGIVAFFGPRTRAAVELVSECLLEASRRGTHATGIAWLEDGNLAMESAPVPARDFLDYYDLHGLALADRTLALVAHTRYSTSDLRWNLPLEDRDCALVLNGVISQDSPTFWPRCHDEDYEPYHTGNDAEVALRFAKKGYRGYTPGSFAIVELWENHMFAYRNAYRPLYHAGAHEGVLIASSQDMLRRCGLEGYLMAPGVVWDVPSRGAHRISKFPTDVERQPPFRDPRDLRCPTA